jgi:voltage-gated potassium channel
MTHWRRLEWAIIALAGVLVLGTVGYLLLGFTLLDALYQTVTTVSTVGFREVEPFSPVGQVFTMVLILFGVGAAFYAFSALVETFIEGRLYELFGRRRMDKTIASMSGHVVICGWGRVGREIGAALAEAGRSAVVIDADEAKLGDAPIPVQGDATEDEVLRQAGIERASALVAAADSDAANSFIVLSARALNPDLFVVARARSRPSIAKLERAGADRVVNPQSIGGSRMAAFVVRPHVAEFLDVVMHEGNLEFLLEEALVAPGSPLAGRSLRDGHIRDQTGALVLAIRDEAGRFKTNPPPETVVAAGDVIIGIGTQAELDALVVIATADAEVPATPLVQD